LHEKPTAAATAKAKPSHGLLEGTEVAAVNTHLVSQAARRPSSLRQGGARYRTCSPALFQQSTRTSGAAPVDSRRHDDPPGSRELRSASYWRETSPHAARARAHNGSPSPGQHAEIASDSAPNRDRLPVGWRQRLATRLASRASACRGHHQAPQRHTKEVDDPRAGVVACHATRPCPPCQRLSTRSGAPL
jgi:hypothetical protein